jgi:hypothetical protein
MLHRQREEALLKQREEARKIREEEDRARKLREQAERKEREDLERKRLVELELQAQREEAERRQKEETERQRVELERKQLEEVERQKREEAEQLRLAEEVERKAREDLEHEQREQLDRQRLAEEQRQREEQIKREECQREEQRQREEQEQRQREELQWKQRSEALRRQQEELALQQQQELERRQQLEQMQLDELQQDEDVDMSPDVVEGEDEQPQPSMPTSTSGSPAIQDSPSADDSAERNLPPMYRGKTKVHSPSFLLPSASKVEEQEMRIPSPVHATAPTAAEGPQSPLHLFSTHVSPVRTSHSPKHKPDPSSMDVDEELLSLIEDRPSSHHKASRPKPKPSPSPQRPSPPDDELMPPPPPASIKKKAEPVKAGKKKGMAAPKVIFYFICGFQMTYFRIIAPSETKASTESTHKTSSKDESQGIHTERCSQEQSLCEACCCLAVTLCVCHACRHKGRAGRRRQRERRR